ncbi:NUDIX hydrolase [Cryptosporangium arvum]|uniref:NUDIX hydrolase n=1 Tax=Cryptosporangium arvum TaxID=80871 RepID=UPI0004B48C06|nr:NUDIX hydrolase N-terminal domain-containing protein [Cryptosporangium arvum]
MVTPLAPTLHRMAIELAAMAQNGLTYSTDHYDADRYTRMRALSAELMGLITDAEPAAVEAVLALEAGHATPKVDVRGALFDDEDRVLLVREARDGRWTLPGGWADALDRPSHAAEREFAEEAGLAVRATKLAAVYDGSVHNGHSPAGPWHIYKLFFVMERLDDAAPVAGLDGETSDVAFFALDALPELSTARTTAHQLRRALVHTRDQAEPADFD